jgi:hypothetical protein
MAIKRQNSIIGIIAEDDSDVDSIKVLMKRIAQTEALSVKKFVGRGCGKIRRKSKSWAEMLKSKGCSSLILIHDLDRNNLGKLKRQIEQSITPCPIEKYLICIPVEEMEAWWLSDPQAIQKALKLATLPKVSDHPERINSPKEFIGGLVKKCSENKKIYLNTKHNEMIAAALDIEKAMRCESFISFYDFVSRYITVADA